MVANVLENPNFYQRPKLSLAGEEPNNLVDFPVRRTSYDYTPFKQDFAEILQLQEKFDLAIREYSGSSDFKTTKENLLGRSYNPVVDWWHIERLRRAGGEEGLAAFKLELRRNIQTNIMERLRTQESSGKLIIKNGQLYSADFSERPFGEIIRFGAEYRAKLGSKEQEREGELGELAGWEYINSVMTDSETSLNTTVYSFSPRGLLKETNYDAWFVDEYKLLQGENGERYAKRVRTTVNWSYDEYRKTALFCDPNYFGDYDGRPIDAWYLSHPIKKNTNILKGVLDESKIGMVKEKFAKIFPHPSLQRLIERYEKTLFASEIDWVSLALSFNSILNCVDELEKTPIKSKGESYSSSKEDSNMRGIVNNIAFMDESSFASAVAFMGRQTVRTRTGGGCPANKGINFGGFGRNADIVKNTLDILSNSVAKFGVKKKTEGYSFDKIGDCVVCKREKIAVGPCDICELCDNKIQAEKQDANFDLNEGIFDEIDLAA